MIQQIMKQQKRRLLLSLLRKKKVVVLFGTLKVQSFIVTEVSDCGLLIVVTSSNFLTRKGILKKKRQLAQIIKTRSLAFI